MSLEEVLIVSALVCALLGACWLQYLAIRRWVKALHSLDEAEHRFMLSQAYRDDK